MVKKVEGWQAWDATVHPSMDSALKHEFDLMLDNMMEALGEPPITGPQKNILWKNKDKIHDATAQG